ncbi:hypothetical protein LEP1GSC125_3122 [Leptospira mayottensis 200901122]|uniref:Uncharacterized protein n=1 Tax=Leptospira mayottensis 200901122 TaxID=1193010 RepID=A0AA87MM72_9LEPT|nr:hypothetical protein LEP1GSC125_3122 [Leptospira mayottensis 200901122]
MRNCADVFCEEVMESSKISRIRLGVKDFLVILGFVVSGVIQ